MDSCPECGNLLTHHEEGGIVYEECEECGWWNEYLLTGYNPT